MSAIRCGEKTVEVAVERDDRGVVVYVPACCSARYASMKVLRVSHMSTCPRDRQIARLLDAEGGS